ncbi:FAD-dependent 2-octaprenylphenol hydroxylase [Gallibacterium anatis]|uniref:2-octaprenyl-3-methyl-6-methoxy-1,4-benzoquinol hydroxylase n=1 Tax=Gallibacterium anatis TaxID=750 RepID=A0A1A7P3B8_9PAST|nr:FAD-dependent 2-octaprenylphenol hydroxylase [Gallibacterium anatis]KGQ57573.1 oxidoreductase [Gallibacterium anatis DSM 16844 = F 149]OBW95724.1 oxidoreductase [Gallibacterium anatis]OBW99676.1 oxidoreductase [Gallibacterium anatis]STO36935.1 2-octaprenyl-3-methyl-6-methoxy-1,4-benzoquinol hydroxylase [Gallibacterium anatis]
MKTFDIVVIGGGMVGLAFAQALKQSACSIAVIEANNTVFDLSNIGYRVSALNLSSEAMLRQFDVWQQLKAWRATAYAEMQVWEKDSFGRIELNTEQLGVEHLGHIVENQLIRQALYQAVVAQENAEVIVSRPVSLGVNQDNAILGLENGEILVAKLVVGADGANSWLRQQANIPLVFRDYQHSALVCNVETEEPHQQICRQIFSPDAILAFLPLHQPHLSSIVWSQDPAQAEAMASCDPQQFNRYLTTAFDNRLGLCKLVTQRSVYPLTARFARQFAAQRIALVGDAAHTIHPLAGLGVNLGFMDALALAEEVDKHLAQDKDIGSYRHLRHYERWRKAEALKMLAAMQGFKDLFAGEQPLKKLIRGVGLSLTNQFSPIKQQFIQQATGLSGDLPQRVRQLNLFDLA